MKDGPDIARVAALIGDPARANMLTALMAGRALTAGELAREAGIAPATASGHLAQLSEAGLISPRRQGRHRYFEIGGEDVGRAIEALTGLAATRGHLRTRTGPRDPALRAARVCYDHLAGALSVEIFDAMARRRLLELDGDGVALSDAGRGFVEAFGIPVERLARSRRPVCRACLDWSERRSHLAGALGAAMLDRFVELGWMRRKPGTRVVDVTAPGLRELRRSFGIV